MVEYSVFNMAKLQNNIFCCIRDRLFLFDLHPELWFQSYGKYKTGGFLVENRLTVRCALKKNELIKDGFSVFFSSFVMDSLC